jgi:hypothetical protein
MMLVCDDMKNDRLFMLYIESKEGFTVSDVSEKRKTLRTAFWWKKGRIMTGEKKTDNERCV